MTTVRFLDDDMNEIIVNVIIIEKSDIRPLFDNHIRSIELSSGEGWMELWNIDGLVCGYIEEEEV